SAARCGLDCSQRHLHGATCILERALDGRVVPNGVGEMLPLGPIRPDHVTPTAQLGGLRDCPKGPNDPAHPIPSSAVYSAIARDAQAVEPVTGHLQATLPATNLHLVGVAEPLREAGGD